MNEEEKKTIEKFVEKCNKFDESVEIKGVSVGEEYRILETVCKALDLVEELQKENENLSHENRKLRTIRYDTTYGVESIYLITKRDLVEINTNKYFIEIQDGKFVDLKQVYQENEKLNKYKENYISVQKVKDKIEEEKLPLTIVGGRKNKKTLEYGIKLGRRQALQELIEEREEK